MTVQTLDAEDREVLRRRAQDRLAKAREWNATANPPLVARMSDRVQIDAGDLLALLDQLEQAERDRDRNLRSSRLAKEERIKANARADQAEARIKAVRDLHNPYGDTLTGLYVCTACDQPCPCPTTRALESVPPPGQ